MKALVWCTCVATVSMRVRTLGAAASVLVICTAPAPSYAQPIVPPAYAAVVRQYAGGDREAAVAVLLGWPEVRLRDAVRLASSLAATAHYCDTADCIAALQWSTFPVTAALMLHTDAALRQRARGASPRLHESAAAELTKLALQDPKLREFVCEWHVGMALRAQKDARWGDALDWAERGLKEFPDAVDLLLVVASVEEVHAAQDPAAPPPDVFDGGAGKVRANAAINRERRQHLERARAAARAALTAAPDSDAAGVRLGRIEWKLGEYGEGQAVLESVLQRGPGVAWAYLANLFLGRVHEDAGRREDAARCYEKAATLVTRAQAARLALSHVRFEMGDPATARQELELAIRPAGFGRPSDPFWGYAWGASDQADARLEALRQRVTP